MSRTAQVSRAAVFSVAAAALLMGGFSAGAVSHGHETTGAALETLSSGRLTGLAGVSIGWDAMPLDNIGWDSPGSDRATAGTPTQTDATCSSFICT
ncbi:hypothetical protein ACFYZ3_00015 [Streptomyces sp. NPDC001599]|uniref:hypothetical protein n=1 Tax=Streptomyces sp. NPDC001599 TaxID=3364591 RepID=UPI0036BE5139